jgi:hypothetical protein
LNLQPAGIVLAITTFATIGLGHVMVRRFHAHWGTRPAPLLFAISVVVMAGAFATPNDLLSGVLGITAATIFWDGVEIYRQEKRMRRERLG